MNINRRFKPKINEIYSHISDFSDIFVAIFIAKHIKIYYFAINVEFVFNLLYC